MNQFKNKIDKINMFNCDHCKFQIISRKIMDIHNRTFHSKDEKHNCDICGYQVSNKVSLARHKKIVHEGVKYHCRKCDFQGTSRGYLLNTKWQYMKESNTLAPNVTIKQLQKEV